jgi:hypothetical protein
VREVRDSWQVSPLTRTKKLSVLKAFFEFCVEERWITANPARIKAKRNVANRKGDEDSRAGQKNPFTNAEVEGRRRLQGGAEKPFHQRRGGADDRGLPHPRPH